MLDWIFRERWFVRFYPNQPPTVHQLPTRFGLHRLVQWLLDLQTDQGRGLYGWSNPYPTKEDAERSAYGD